ncbi:MAG: AtpZ/AtpI family protein [Armatimonadota bacterium]
MARDERPPEGEEPEPDVGMAEPQVPRPQRRATEEREEKLARELGKAELRKLRARRRREESVWFGLGTFGLVGWSVAVPTLLLLALGVWLDGHYPLGFSWTLTLLFAGIVIGCLNAWYWVSREREEIERRREDLDGD